MSAKLMRAASDFRPLMSPTDFDTFLRLAYRAKRGTDLRGVFDLPKQWWAAVDLRTGPLRALSRSQGYARLKRLVDAGWAELSGNAVRLKLPGDVCILGERVARRVLSAARKALVASVSAVADVLEIVRGLSGCRPANVRKSSGKWDVTDGFIIENDVSLADGRGDALQGAFVASSFGASFEARSEATGVASAVGSGAMRRAERQAISKLASDFVQKNRGLR